MKKLGVILGWIVVFMAMPVFAGVLSMYASDCMCFSLGFNVMALTEFIAVLILLLAMLVLYLVDEL